MLAGKKVLVTGATGFIGGRLVEKLILDHDADVRALVRDFSRASRVARFDIEMSAGSVTDADAVDRAASGCQIVFHCAHDFRRPEYNLEGARSLADACLRHGVRRLIYVSSISVYEPLPDSDVDESSPAEPCGWTYPDNKLAVESLLLRYGEEHDLEMVVLQPTIVYGPFSIPWTIAPVMRLRHGRVVLPSDREGRCNPVYVDDVVNALILAAEKEEAVGERFLISGPDSLTWHEFFRRYEQMLGTDSIVYMPTEEIERLQTQSNLRLARKDPRRLLSWRPVRRLYGLARRRLLTDSFRERARRSLPKPLHLPDPARLALYRALALVRTEKARRRLGYAPAFSFDRGMSLTAQFVAWANL